MNGHEHLITPQDFRELARPVSVHLDEIEVEAYIDECENMHIIPAIGYDTFKIAVEGGVWTDIFDETFVDSIFLDGGDFVPVRGLCNCVCSGDGTDYCVGLRKALAYFVYAKMGRADGSIMARSGYMRHDDQYASHVPTDKKQYDDVMTIAEQYLASCLRYAKEHYKNVRPMPQTRAKIKAIGD